MAEAKLVESESGDVLSPNIAPEIVAQQLAQGWFPWLFHTE